LIPPWAFWRRNLPRFLFLKSPRVLRYLRILPTVKPSFLRRTVSFAFEKAGIPPGVFASPLSFGVHWGFWIFLGFSTYPSGLWGFLGFRFFFHRKEAPDYAYLLQVTATEWGLSKVEDFKANPSFFGESMDLSKLSNGIP